MSEAVTPEQKQLLIAGYVLCDLSPEESILLQNLLAEDPELQVELEAMQEVLDTTYLTEVEPPAHLRDAVMAAYGKDAVQPSPPQLSVVTPAKKMGWQRAVGAIAASLIVGLSISNYMLWRSLQNQTKVVAQLQFVLESTASNQTPITAQVKVDPERLQGTLLVENLPPLNDNQVYVLWTVVKPNTPVTTDDKNAILTEVFTVDNQGSFATEVAMPSVFRDLNFVQAVAITVENREAPQRHQSTPILIGAVETAL